MLVSSIGRPTLWLVALATLGGAPTSPAQTGNNRGVLNSQLPQWLTLGIQQRIRTEGLGDIRFVDGDNDTYTVSRLLLDVDVQPTRYLRFHAQGIDSRAFGLDTDLPNRPNVRDTFDLRQGFVVIGNEAGGLWDVTVGRQELIFGSERLLGVNRWANIPRFWDAAKLAFHRGENRVDIFASSVVRVDPDDFDRIVPGENVHGIYGSVGSLLGNQGFEPHVLWRTRPSVVDERGFVGDSDIFTGGARWTAGVGEAWKFTGEADFQWGTFARDDVRAWTAMAGASYEFATDWSPTVLAEYNFASGDSERGDGKIERFDQILARAHRIWGIVDQIGQRNSKIALTGVTLHPLASLQIKVDHYFFWLANRNDGLYRHNGSPWVEAPEGGAESTFVGNEFNVQVNFGLGPYLLFQGGYGRLFRGGFLKRHAGRGSPQLAYVAATFRL